MSTKIKHIKITKPTGQVSFTVFNQETYNRLNDQNKNLAPDRKNKIEYVDISEEEVQKHSGFDEKALVDMNPTAAKLMTENEAKDKTIAYLEAQLAKAKLDAQANAGSGNENAGDEKGKKK